ncbi:MAG TPA: Clp protease N-terminal domain-containing protein [Ktedonobacteraceae bacterium]|nr:Clp protease N-terminal domain-containing protein [Ktedonobacteraceae bacterium]
MSEQNEEQTSHEKTMLPAIPLERYTEQGRQVLAFADEEARRLNHNYIGTEHLLLGILRVENCIATSVLHNLGIDLARVRRAVEYIVKRGEQPVVGEIGMTPRAVVVNGMAFTEAGRLYTEAYAQQKGWEHVRIAPEHILLGLLQEGEGIAAGVLERGFGVKKDQIRSQIYQSLSNSGQWAEQTTLKDVALAKNSVVTCRIIGSDLDAIDTLIEAGIRTTRSEAAAWLIHAGIEANKELLEQVYGTVAEIRRLRLTAQNLVQQSTESKSSKPTQPQQSTQEEQS